MNNNKVKIFKGSFYENVDDWYTAILIVQNNNVISVLKIDNLKTDGEDGGIQLEGNFSWYKERINQCIELL